MRAKGLRNLRTIQGNLRRSRTGSREQTAAELARLEHERARLRREAAMWEGNRLRTEEQLKHVETRLSLLRGKLAESEPSEPEPPDDGWNSMSLEY